MAFTPRLTEPTNTTTYYGSYNSYNRYSSYGNEGNCTWYAYGRTGEIAGRNIYNDFYINGGSGYGHGKDWIYNTWPSYTHTSGTIDLHLGDILVWGGGRYGHVEVVEAISGNNITTSYSISGDNWSKSRYFGVRTITKPSWGSELGWVEYNDGSSSYLRNTFIGYIHNKYVDSPTPPTPSTDTPTVVFTPASYTTTMSGDETYKDFDYTVTVSGIPINEDASDAISFTNCYRLMYTSGWNYTDYTVDGVRYRRGVRSLIIRYERAHDYAYTGSCYMYYRKTFSNGSIDSNTRMRITVQKLNDEVPVEVINHILKRKKKKMNVEII